MYQFGEVKDINDPEKLGRVKVSVYGFHDDIPVKELGWSNVVMPANTPATLGQGHSVNLREEVLWKTGDLLPTPLTTPAPEFKVITDVAPDYTFDAGSNVPRTGDVREQGSLVCGMFLDPAMQEFLVFGSIPTKTVGIQSVFPAVFSYINAGEEGSQAVYPLASKVFLSPPLGRLDASGSC